MLTKFRGRNQHDSQEFLAFLIDKFHEDLNKVIEKPYMVVKDYVPGTSEIAYYETVKANYKARNDSIIHDIFYGTFRTETICSNCKHISLKFEPFNMLSLPIPITTKETVMGLTFYFIGKFCLYDFIKIECQVGKEITLKSIKDGITSSKNIDTENTSFYMYDGKTFEWNESKILDDPLSEVVFPENNFFFLVEDKTSLTQSTDSVNVLFRIENIRPETVSGIRKIIKMNPNTHVKDLYAFFFGCLKEVFGDAIGTFEECLSKNNVKTRLFDLYFKEQNLEYNTEDQQGQTLALTDNTEIVVKIHNEGLSRHKKLNNLGVSNSERYPDGDITLKKCLESLMNPEKLDQENQWFCEKCKQRTRAHFEMTIKELPNILIVHLKRFKRNTSGTYSKITESVYYPSKDLSLASFTTEPTLAENQATYSLFGVVNHSGSVSFGHYTSSVCNRTNHNNWVECDDEYVTSYDSNPQLSKSKAYILFYRRNPQATNQDSKRLISSNVGDPN